MYQTFLIQAVDCFAGLVGGEPFQVLAVVREVANDPGGINSQSIAEAPFLPSSCQAATDAGDAHDRGHFIENYVHILDRNNLTKVALLLASNGNTADNFWEKGKCLDLIQHREGMSRTSLKILKKRTDMLSAVILREHLLAIVPHGEVPGFTFSVFRAKLAHGLFKDDF